MTNWKNPRSIGAVLGALTVVLLCLVGGALALDHARVGRYLHPSASLTRSDLIHGLLDERISDRKAAAMGVAALLDRDVHDIEICEVRWITAPLGGFLVDAKGHQEAGEAVYSVFRIGVRDGSEEGDGGGEAGEVFVFIARGEDTSGNVHWNPPGGPLGSSDLDYEFLPPGDRAAVASLSSRYP